MKASRFTLVVVVSALPMLSQSGKPPKGYVPDAATATRIAEAVLVPIYGKTVLGERPFKAELKNGVWDVGSAIRCQENLPGPQSCHGGHWVRLAKDDGRILEVGQSANAH